MDTVGFEKILELFASEYPADLHIIQLDNGGFHNSLNLSRPPECYFTISARLQSGSKPNSKTVGICKGTIEMVEI